MGAGAALMLPPHFENRSLSLSLVVLVTGTLPTNTVRCSFSSSSSGLGCEGGGGGEVHTITMRGGEGERRRAGGEDHKTLSFPFLWGGDVPLPLPRRGGGPSAPTDLFRSQS